MARHGISKNVFVMIATLAALSWVAFGVSAWRVRHNDVRIHTLSDTAAEAVAKGGAAQAARAAYIKNADLITALDATFLPKGSEAGTLSYIEDLAERTGASANIATVASEADTSVKEAFKDNVRIRVEFVGDWDSVSSYAAALERLPFAGSVENVRISLFAAADRLAFSTSTASRRSRGPEEQWRGSAELVLYKIK